MLCNITTYYATCRARLFVSKSYFETLKKRILGLREMLDTTCCATLRHVALDYLSAKNILKHLEYECCDFARWIRHVTQTYDMPRSIICERKLFCNTRNTNTRTSRDVRYDMLRNLTTCRARFVV